jgi:hypothetical protein
MRVGDRLVANRDIVVLAASDVGECGVEIELGALEGSLGLDLERRERGPSGLEGARNRDRLLNRGGRCSRCGTDRRGCRSHRRDGWRLGRGDRWLGRDGWRLGRGDRWLGRDDRRLGRDGWWLGRDDRWRGHGGRLRDIRVEPVLLRPHAQDIAASQQLRSGDTRAVHPHAVRAVIGEHVAILRRRDARVLAGHLARGEDDVVADFASEGDACGPHGVLPAVDQGDEAPAGGGGGLLRRTTRLTLLHHRGDVGRAHELGAPPLLVVTHAEFVPCDLDAVAMEQRARLDTEAHAVHQHNGVRRPAADDHTAGAHGHHRSHARIAVWQSHIGALEGADARIALRKGELLVVELQIWHSRGKLPGLRGVGKRNAAYVTRRWQAHPLAIGRVLHTVRRSQAGTGGSLARALRRDAARESPSRA